MKRRMIFNCKQLAEKKLKKIPKDKPLSLGVIQIGKDDVSDIFINEKKKAAQKADFSFNHYKFPETIPLDELERQIKSFPDDGLIIQLPIPDNFPTQEVLNMIPFEKDVDCLSETSLGKLYTDELDILPPVVGAVDKIIKNKKIELKGKVLAVVGPGRLVGKPTLLYGLSKKATVFSIDENTENKKELIKKADLVVTGVGRPGLITAEMIKKGALVIDAGTSKKNGKIVGDVREEVAEKATLTPVPGGVGPLTVVSLLDNLVKKSS